MPLGGLGSRGIGGAAEVAAMAATARGRRGKEACLVDEELTLIFDSTREQGLPSHYRTMAGPFATTPTPPSRLGLDRLRASGSEQPSRSELDTTIRGLADKVTVVDLRQESHALLDAHPVSWYGPKNWANDGKTVEEAEADEAARIRALPTPGTASVARVLAKSPDGRLSETQVEPTPYKRARSERETLGELGLGAFRIAVRDHSPPADADVDRFVAFVRELPGDAWLHFHCHAGDGRTTTFLLLYDMLRNAAALGLEELAVRQRLLGGIDLLHTPHEGWKGPLYDARAAFLGRFHRYAATRDFHRVLWTQYQAAG
ncbi:phosphatase [Solidesulfovibrio sp.]|uniref:phosphatase domain-containing putative toxin n=1 Tax=Solidesulfovibrio sp. TaxID=2910990 RepID=UPI0026247B92|nr:phosphatase [Solidesulfovibrio sp.]